ncbi:MAG: TonB-dependent receptor [Sphingomonas sp.]|nr:TonB-dependent receptor [Sphingomonas sp.]
MVVDLPPAAPQGEIIIVTGKALPDPPSERAYRVEILGRGDLEDSPAQGLDQVLRQVPGLQYFRRSGADSAHPTSQGVTLRALGGNASSRATLVLDGVPQSDPFGGWVNWPAYDPAGLEEVRVIRGGGSVRYGPGALAGAIDMRSLADDRLSASLEAGSRSSFSGRLHSGIDAGGGLVTINARGSKGSGFVPVTEETRGPVDQPAPWREASLRARWIAPLAEQIEVQAGALAFIEERERGVPFTGNRTRGADASLRLVGNGSWQWSVLGYTQWRNMRSSFARVDDDRSAASRVALQDVPSRGLGTSAEVRPPLGGVDLRLGFDARWVDGESGEFATYVEGEPTRRRVAGGSSTTQGIFAEATFSIGKLELSGGARLDHWRIGSGELVERPILAGPPTLEEYYAPRTGWEPMARLGATFGLSGETKLRVAAYRGWRLPTLNELFRPFRAGADATAANAALDPERLSGAELGFDYRKDNFDLGLTAFANRLSGAIANVTLGQGPGIFPGIGFVAGSFRQRQNVDAVKVVGLETSAAVQLGPWSGRIGASLNRSRVEANGAAAAIDGLRPAQTPAFSFSASLGWEKRGRSFKLMVHHSGTQYEDDLNRRRLAPATTVDALARWPLSNRLELIARAVNFLDDRVIAGMDDDGSIERSTPRSFWLGIRLHAD